jgi:hypothetical protein
MGRNLYGDPQRAIAGQQFGLSGHTRTYAAGEKLYPGDPVFGMVGDSEHCYGVHLNAVTLTASANLVTGNKVAVVVNGIALPVVEFVESTKKTLEKVVQEIELDGDLSELEITAFAVEGARAFTIVGPGISISASAVVTEGASQATFSSAADTDLKFVGVAEHTELCARSGTGYYEPEDSVNVRDFGEIYVPVADDADPADKEQAYIILSGDEAGLFTNEADGNYDCGAFFRSNKQDGLARVELRGMK